MCHPPAIRRFIHSANNIAAQELPSKENNTYTSQVSHKRTPSPSRSQQSRLPAFRELFLASRQLQPGLTINTHINNTYRSSITIPVNSEDEDIDDSTPSLSSTFDNTSCDMSPSPIKLNETQYDESPEISPMVQSAEKRLEFAEHLVDTAVELIESIWTPVPANSSLIPTLRSFIQEFLRRSHCSFSNLQLALLYIVRLKNNLDHKEIAVNAEVESKYHYRQQRRNEVPHTLMEFARIHESSQSQTFTSLNQIHPALRCGRRMFLTALIIACKYLNDKPPSNQAWATLSGLSLSEINANERTFLSVINFDLYVIHDVYVKWTQLLLKASMPCEKTPTIKYFNIPCKKVPSYSSSTGSSPSTLYSGSVSRDSSPVKSIIDSYRKTHVDIDGEGFDTEYEEEY
ncbi:hypothetical protein HK098_002397 [Nowakowskiella sp. JEL0407]|nr:hypothetical protein HK098_002397 [Nowakowskiella sp. JEL0407]